MDRKRLKSDLKFIFQDVDATLGKAEKKHLRCEEWDDNADKYYWTSTSSSVSSDSSMSSRSDTQISFRKWRSRTSSSDKSDRPQSNEDYSPPPVNLIATHPDPYHISGEFETPMTNDDLQPNVFEVLRNVSYQQTSDKIANSAAEREHWFKGIALEKGPSLRESHIIRYDKTSGLNNYNSNVGRRQVHFDDFSEDDTSSSQSSSSGRSNPLRNRIKMVKKRFHNEEKKSSSAFVPIAEHQRKKKKKVCSNVGETN